MPVSPLRARTRPAMSTSTPAPTPLAAADVCVPAPTLAPSEHNLIWIDLEMTGLDPDQDRIIEVAVVVTDPQVTVRVEGPVIAVHQGEEILARMDKWNRNTHGKSGLTQRVRESTVGEAEAQSRVLDFLRRHVPQGKSPMCGNSVCQDRRFLVRGMPALEAWFHYRNLDVSTLKELARRWAPQVLDSFKKAQKHTALADIHESIDELLHYRAHLLR
jgi:oligoribonuclease